ncbi:uncharacterized protein SRS1_17606 [Sporisorium reilianum f. sp. reilianum]|uniref:Zn(2)-C6 fungal-type domain-containing protein n=1 Tax=Sporisorium reilianum f. sp. reilianum TaxID=72559 RepID=A0A2N8UKU4_9BASI|nr:uncharacterized protein SRS1_17606 [Sporisorium reilianum f. sp. reilianum]
MSSSGSTPKRKKTSKSKGEPTPPRERSLRACTRCRQRKQKCDNALPNCGNCVKGGVPCEAFPVNVVSRDNLLQIYDQLQESKRRNAALQNELCLARLVVPDTLALFSAVIAQQVTTGSYQGGNDRQSNSRTSNPGMQSEQGGSLAITSAETKPNPQTDSLAADPATTTQPPAAEPDIWKTIELLEACFPAVASAICIAAEQPDQKLDCKGVGKLGDIAAVPIRDLQTLLSGSATYASQSRFQGLSVEMKFSVDDLTSRLIAANGITRIAATLLWALLAFVQHRTEELLRMDTVLTCFMQAWQAATTSTSAAVAMHDAVSVSLDFDFGGRCRSFGIIRLIVVSYNVTLGFAFLQMSLCRAYDWVHLRE